MRTLWTIFISLIALTGCTAPTDRYTFEHRQMGTAFRLVLYGSDAKSATEAAAAAWQRVDRLNAIMSDWDPRSELSKLSATAGSGRAVRLSQPLWAILSRSKQWSERTDGAFDITVGPAVHLWRRYRRQQKMPPKHRLETARRAIGYQKLLLDPENRTATLTAPNMRLDLGAIAKGHAADEVLRIVQQAGFASALVDAGGDVVLGAPPPGRAGWRVALMPHPTQGTRRYLIASDCAVATSGDAFRYTLIDGVRYSHIVNPKTAIGLVDAPAVTAVAPTGQMADALASSLSVLGVRHGLAFIEKIDGASAMMVLPPQAGGTVHFSKGFLKLRTTKAEPDKKTAAP
ncbi:MAG: FAD:protein FMN transferase [Phycisphaeraceae bacterium]|nr:FAD:protein FMN transferase [Phycisphaeraceae bacterium]